MKQIFMKNQNLFKATSYVTLMSWNIKEIQFSVLYFLVSRHDGDFPQNAVKLIFLCFTYFIPILAFES